MICWVRKFILFMNLIGRDFEGFIRWIIWRMMFFLFVWYLVRILSGFLRYRSEYLNVLSSIPVIVIVIVQIIYELFGSEVPVFRWTRYSKYLKIWDLGDFLLQDGNELLPEIDAKLRRIHGFSWNWSHFEWIYTGWMVCLYGWIRIWPFSMLWE